MSKKKRNTGSTVETMASKPDNTPLFKGVSIQDRSLLMLGLQLNKSTINNYIYLAQQGDMRRFSALKREILVDPFVSGEVNKIKSKLISSPITFSTFPGKLTRPSLANTAEAKHAFEITDYVKEQLLDSSELLREAIAELWYGLLDGVAVIEILAEVQSGKVVLTGLSIIPQERICYVPNTTTLGVQLTDDAGTITPLDQLNGNFIVLVADSNDPNPARRGLTRKCIGPWFTARYLQEWWSRSTEVNGQSTRVAKYNPSDREMKGVLESLLSKAGSANYMVLPEGTTIEFLNSITAANTDLYSKLLDSCHEQISIALLGSTQTTQIKPNSGSRASSTIHFEVSNNTVNGYALTIASILRDQLISRLVEWQFSPEDSHKYTPSLEIRVMGYEDVEKMATAIPALVAVGLPISHSYIYDATGIPLPDPQAALLAAPVAASPFGGKPTTSPNVDTPSPEQLLQAERFQQAKSTEQQIGDLLIKPYVDHVEKVKAAGGDLKQVLNSLHLYARSRGEDKVKAEKIVTAYIVDQFTKGYSHATSGN